MKIDLIGIKDLEPKDGSLRDKFKLNCIAGHPDRGDVFVGLRASRVNHSCRPNACYTYEETARVSILYALRDIRFDEEICVNYTYVGIIESDNDVCRPKDEMHLSPSEIAARYGTTDPVELEFARTPRSLRVNWGITCPADCFCMDPQSKKLVVEGKRFLNEMHQLASKGRTDAALVAGDRVLEIDRELNMLWTHRGAINIFLFQMAIASSKTEAMAKQYLESSVKVSRILSPLSEETRMSEELLKCVEKYNDNYPKKLEMAMVIMKEYCNQIKGTSVTK